MFIKKHTQGEGGGRIHQPGTKHPLGRRDRENQHKKAAGKNGQESDGVFAGLELKGHAGCVWESVQSLCVSRCQRCKVREIGARQRVGEGMRGGLGERGAGGGEMRGAGDHGKKPPRASPAKKNCRTVGDGAGGLRQGVRI
jgi:hypothetical protein